MKETIQKIKLNGLNFILTTPNGTDSPIATIESYSKGECSYAHYYKDGDGRIMRFYQQIGKTEDIEFGEMQEIEFDVAEALDGIMGPTWDI